jgi:hypothetical protein
LKSQELKPAVSVIVMNTHSSINVVTKVRKTSKTKEKKLTHKLKPEVHERYESIDSIAADLLCWTAGWGINGTHTYKRTRAEYRAINFLTDKTSTKGFSVCENPQN